MSARSISQERGHTPERSGLYGFAPHLRSSVVSQVLPPCPASTADLPSKEFTEERLEGEKIEPTTSEHTNERLLVEAEFAQSRLQVQTHSPAKAACAISRQLELARKRQQQEELEESVREGQVEIRCLQAILEEQQAKLAMKRKEIEALEKGLFSPVLKLDVDTCSFEPGHRHLELFAQHEKRDTWSTEEFPDNVGSQSDDDSGLRWRSDDEGGLIWSMGKPCHQEQEGRCTLGQATYASSRQATSLLVLPKVSNSKKGLEVEDESWVDKMLIEQHTPPDYDNPPTSESLAAFGQLLEGRRAFKELEEDPSMDELLSERLGFSAYDPPLAREHLAWPAPPPGNRRRFRRLRFRNLQPMAY